MMRCPGQDPRFWRPQDIFEAACPHCGMSVEFWKDELRVKCPRCRRVIANPKLDLGCAQWCLHARQCLEALAHPQSIPRKRLLGPDEKSPGQGCS